MPHTLTHAEGDRALTNPLTGIGWLLRQAIRNEVMQPIRRQLFSHKSSPFAFSTRDGYVFVLHPGEYIDSVVFVDGMYERRFVDLVKNYWRGHPGAVALDVGAHIGLLAIYLSDCFSRVICFDPNPLAVQRLRENIALNQLRNIEVHAVGLSDKYAQLPFRIRPHNLGASRFQSDSDEGTMALPVVIGDDYLEGLHSPQVDFIKVDVEFHEPEVFCGLRRTIARCRPVVAFEWHGNVVGQERFDTLAEALPGYMFVEPIHGPASTRLIDKAKWKIRHQGVPVLRLFERPERRLYENILALPNQEALASLLATNGRH